MPYFFTFFFIIDQRMGKICGDLADKLTAGGLWEMSLGLWELVLHFGSLFLAYESILSASSSLLFEVWELMLGL